ncbi:MAG: hypothetical protein M1308_14980 [Actinobacteria bacterium]|nr:hypothetical protein [Actinomycetota bacterium]
MKVLNDPLVLLLVEGLGMSSSWNGNAVLTGNPKNFFDLWAKYPHTLLNPSLGLNKEAVFENNESIFSTLSTGVNALYNSAFLTEQINENLVEKNILKAFDRLNQQKSNLHFVGNLSSSAGKYGDINHLLALLKLAKKRSLYNVYIHLIVDDSEFSDLREILSLLNALTMEINKIGVGEIASICGQKFISDDAKSADFILAYKAMVEGKGYVGLSAEQAFNLFKGNSSIPDHLTPRVISFRGKPIGKFSNFDVVIFFNHNNDSISRFILSISQDRSQYRGINLPKFIETYVFFKLFPQQIGNLKVIYPTDPQNTLTSLLLGAGIKQSYISDYSRIDHIKSYFQGSVKNTDLVENIFISEGQLDNHAEIFNRILSLLKKELDVGSKFILIDIPLIYRFAIKKSFNETVSVIKKFDDFLPQLMKTVFDKKGTIILTSNHGCVEQLVTKSHYERINNKTLNPLPFLYLSSDIAPKSNIQSGGNRLIYDILDKKRHNLIDIAPTILELLGIPRPANMEGQSFISELI